MSSDDDNNRDFDFGHTIDDKSNKGGEEDPNEGFDYEDCIPCAAATSMNAPGAAVSVHDASRKRKRGTRADKQIVAASADAVININDRISNRICRDSVCQVAKLELLSKFQLLWLVQTVQIFCHGVHNAEGEDNITKRQVLFAERMHHNAGHFCISAALVLSFCEALKLETKNYPPLDQLEHFLEICGVSSLILCTACMHAMCNLRGETTQKAIANSGEAFVVKTRVQQSGRVEQNHHGVSVKWEHTVKFWRYWLTPGGINQDDPPALSISEPIPGSRPYLRILFTSYLTAYLFLVGMWDVGVWGALPGQTTCANVLAILGTSLKRRSKLLAANPNLAEDYIGGLACRLRSFNKDHFPECLICASLKAMMSHASLPFRQISAARAAWKLHVVDFSNDIRAMDAMRLRCIESIGGLFLSVDGMSQFTARIPFFKRNCGDFGQHLIGVIVAAFAGTFGQHTGAELKILYRLFEHLAPAGGDETIEVLVRVLFFLRSLNVLNGGSIPWPSHLYLQVDGAR